MTQRTTGEDTRAIVQSKEMARGRAPNRAGRGASVVPLVLAGAAIVLAWDGGPGTRLFVGTVVAYVGLKAWLFGGPHHASWVAMRVPARIAMAVVWPGFDPAPFLVVDASERAVGRRWIIEGVSRLAVGLVVLGAAARTGWPDEVRVWAATVGLFLVVHLGYADVLSGSLRLMGYRVTRAFDAPWRSTSLADFWSRRWNHPFVEMDRQVFLPLLTGVSRRQAAFTVFLISGLLHELAISYPARAGWGLPLGYFTLHAVLVSVERRWFHIHRWPRALATMWTLGWVVLPTPILFHRPFRTEVLLPFVDMIREVI